MSRLIIVVFHELGHAIAGLILYEGKIDVYIGSYGDPTKGIHFKLKRLMIHFIYNPFSWDRGLCVAEAQNVSYKRTLVYIIGGPLGSLSLAILFLSLLLTPLDSILKVYAFLVFFYAFADFLNNSIPKPKVIKLYNGNTIFNDGQTLKTILKEKKNYGLSNKLIEFYTQKEFKKGKACYESMDKSTPNPMVIRLGAYLYLMLRETEACLKTFEELVKIETLTADDHCNFALAYSYVEKNAEAMTHYNKSLALQPEHVYTLNNRGYLYNLLEEYEKGIADFDKAIAFKPDFGYAYNNRGLAKIKLGFTAEGLQDIETSLKLDQTNSYAYRNKGIYYLDLKNYNDAYDYFLKAKELDSLTHHIDKYIAETKQLIAETTT